MQNESETETDTATRTLYDALERVKELEGIFYLKIFCEVYLKDTLTEYRKKRVKA